MPTEGQGQATHGVGVETMGMTPVQVAPGARRVRHQAREVIAVMAFSGATSLMLAVALMLVLSLGR